MSSLNICGDSISSRDCFVLVVNIYIKVLNICHGCVAVSSEKCGRCGQNSSGVAGVDS